MINFEDYKLDLTKLVCNSGGAPGSDTIFEEITIRYGGKVNAFSYKTSYHNSPNKVEISDEDYQEGVKKVQKTNLSLNRYGIHKYMNMLSRNWAQVKYSNQVIAIGKIIKPGEKGSRGFYSKSKTESVDGGTGYAVSMCIDEGKELIVFDQIKKSWFRWSYISNSFILLKETPKITSENFAGIGTREINEYGIQAIEDLFKKTFNKL